MSPPTRRSRALAICRFVAVHVLRAVWISTMVLTPLFGFWLASSLAAYKNASQWLSLLLGLALFPLLPVGWELFSTWRRRRRGATGKQVLTRIDRLVLRTLAINGAFLAIMSWQARGVAFRSLSVRGDWMLDGYDGRVAGAIRGVLLGIADKLDGRHGTDDDGGRYGTSDDAPDPSKIKHRDDTPVPVKPGEHLDHPPKTAWGWPYDDAPDPKIVDMPASASASIAAVGAYVEREFPDKKLRVKAIHDFVALRLTYDDEALKQLQAGDYANVPSQEAEAVFASKKAVCAGYAKLMVAIGSAANLEIKYITGYIRDASRRVAPGTDAQVKATLEGYSHAWNAVLIDDEWFLVDTTWDDPTGAKTPVQSTYLFTPPALFAYDHLPEDPAWQLVMNPISAGDFARLPMLSPEIGRLGITLESPNRSQVSVSGSLAIELDNPYAADVMAWAYTDGTREGGTPCSRATTGHETTLTCKLSDGEYEVKMFAAPSSRHDGRLAHPEGTGSTSVSLAYIGSILANSR